MSATLHAAALFAALPLAPAPLLEFHVPEHVEFGLIEQEPGTSGAPPPAAPPPPPAPAKPVPRRPPQPRPQLDDRPSAVVTVDAGAAQPAPEAGPAVAAEPQADEPVATDTLASEAVSGDGATPYGVGDGLGFGSGGFGSGAGGPPGAVIGLHADLERIRGTSLILEVSTLLEIIPEWQQLLQGSGLDALHDFSRVFVATPSLRRSQLVVSARLPGGEPALVRAIERLASERRAGAQPRTEAGAKVWPWHDRGPTERVVGLFGADQIVIARPPDLARVLGVSAALGERHAAMPEMERAAGTGALLAMYRGEAVALSVEGVRQFLDGDATHAPVGLRISLRPLDEFHAALRCFGYYDSEASAAAAFARLETLRATLAEHPRAQYLGLRSAIDEAVFGREGRTVTVDGRLTMHQTRYLLGFVSRALRPKD